MGAGFGGQTYQQQPMGGHMQPQMGQQPMPPARGGRGQKGDPNNVSMMSIGK